MRRVLLPLLFAFALFSGCGNPHREKDPPLQKTPGESGHETDVRHAHGFAIIGYPYGYHLRLYNPWARGEVLRDYWIGKADSIPSGLNAMVIPSGCRRIAISSTTHAGFLVALRQVDRLVGSTNPERLFDDKLAKRYRDGNLLNLGRDMDFNQEALLDAEPDLILQTAFEGQLAKDKALTATGIPILYMQEWMETSPLGRAEWIKVMGLITGEIQGADSLFKLIEEEYQGLCRLIGPNTPRIKVLSGNNFKGTWFIPGGLNFMTLFFKDAGMTHPWDTTGIQGSLALSFETVFDELADADVWIGINAGTGAELTAMNSRYELFEAFKNRRVYTVSGRENRFGNNDFWESGVVFPNRILADLIYIAHPMILPDHQLLYYRKLSEW